MPPARHGLALAFALALTFAADLACKGNNTGTGGSPQCNSIASSGSGGSPAGSGGAGGGYQACAQCLDTTCGPAAQNLSPAADCWAIQACLDTVCFNLSATAAPTEADCQVYCESLHPAGKLPLTLWVGCVQKGTCQPPCAGYPVDYDQCMRQQNAGACKAAYEACLNSEECQIYECCASNCTTFDECKACAGDTDGGVGEQLYEAWQLCLDTTCLAQEWLPAN